VDVPTIWKELCILIAPLTPAVFVKRELDGVTGARGGNISLAAAIFRAGRADGCDDFMYDEEFGSTKHVRHSQRNQQAPVPTAVSRDL
jgi:hypothetical protein